MTLIVSHIFISFYCEPAETRKVIKFNSSSSIQQIIVPALPELFFIFLIKHYFESKHLFYTLKIDTCVQCVKSCQSNQHL